MYEGHQHKIDMCNEPLEGYIVFLCAAARPVSNRSDQPELMFPHFRHDRPELLTPITLLFFLFT